MREEIRTEDLQVIKRAVIQLSPKRLACSNEEAPASFPRNTPKVTQYPVHCILDYPRCPPMEGS